MDYSMIVQRLLHIVVDATNKMSEILTWEYHGISFWSIFTFSGLLVFLSVAVVKWFLI